MIEIGIYLNQAKRSSILVHTLWRECFIFFKAHRTFRNSIFILEDPADSTDSSSINLNDEVQNSVVVRILVSDERLHKQSVEHKTFSK